MPRLFLPDLPRFAAMRRLAGKLREAGFAVFLVGGAVRDLVMGKLPHDLDLVTSARPDELEKLFPDLRWVGRCFGVSLLTEGEFSFEVATFRNERHYADGRHPEELHFTLDPAEDVLRRDFTVNALLADPETGVVYDYVGGLPDLAAGVVRTVGEPERRFGEDHLRMLRAVRFAAGNAFRLDDAVLSAIQRMSASAAKIPGERVRGELERGLTGADPARFLELLRLSKLLPVLLPEVSALIGVLQNPQYHPEGDVYTHTRLMLSHLRESDALLAWSALLHDIGKAQTTFRDENGDLRAYNHEVVGAELIIPLAERLRFAGDLRDRVVKLVRQHMQLAFVRQMRPAKLRRILSEPDFPTALELHRLDCVCSHGKLDDWCFLLDELRRRPELASRPEPLVFGRDLLARGAAPGPALGRLLAELYERQLSGEFPDREAALAAAETQLPDLKKPN